MAHAADLLGLPPPSKRSKVNVPASATATTPAPAHAVPNTSSAAATAAESESAAGATAAAGAASPDTAPLAVLSWNINGLTDEPHLLRRRLAAAREIIAEKMPHIVLLQELTDDVLEIIRPAMLGLGYAPLAEGRPAFVPAPYYAGAYTRLPALAAAARPFRSVSHMGRHLHTATVQWRGRPLGVFTAHLESLKQGADARLAQGEEVVEAMAQHARSVFGADTNLRVPEYNKLEKRMRPQGIKDAWTAAGAANATKYTWNMVVNDSLNFEGASFKPKCRYDMLWARGLRCVSFELVGDQRLSDELKFPSDHFGILGHFEIED